MNKNSEQLGELFAALSKAQGKIRGAVKDAKNPYFKSNYATLHECWASIRDPLVENGLTIIQTIEEENGKLYLRSILGHSSGQYISSLMPILMAKNDPQALGSATSYSRRYSLCALIGLSQMDDDGEAAMNRKQISKDDEEYIASCEKVETIKEISLEEFCRLMHLQGLVFTTTEMKAYLDHICSSSKKLPEVIMHQALESKNVSRFKKGFEEWNKK